jgi:hypothetical protein
MWFIARIPTVLFVSGVFVVDLLLLWYAVA